MGGKKTEIVHFDIEDGRSIDLPVALVTGDSEGPDAVITAGIHGGEYGGIFAAIRLFRELSPSDIKGSVKFITVCDTAAFETRGSHLTADGAKRHANITAANTAILRNAVCLPHCIS